MQIGAHDDAPVREVATPDLEGVSRVGEIGVGVLLEVVGQARSGCF
jgi:hypothetical protein